MAKIEKENPDKIITIGGNCLVSLAPFDYLHGKYKNTGIVWIDAHPDVSSPKDGYPNAHAMVLGSLMGYGDNSLSNMMKNNKFNPDEILYVGLQNLHDYQKNFLNNTGVNYKIQTNKFISNNEIHKFIKRFDHILVHFDIDVLDEHFFIRLILLIPNWWETVPAAENDDRKANRDSPLYHRQFRYCRLYHSRISAFDEHKLYKMLTEIKLFTE